MEPVNLRSLHLFAGVGGGILGDLLLGHSCAGAVENNPFRRKILKSRQMDGVLPFFPIFEDVRFVKFDATVRVLYDSRYYELRQAVQESSKGSGDVSCGNVSFGNCIILRKNETGNVGVAEESRRENAQSKEGGEEKPLLSGRKNRKRQGSKHSGEGHKKGSGEAIAILRAMWEPWSIQGWENLDSGSPPGLQRSIAGFVAMPEMPPQLAQTLQSNREEVINGEPDRIAYIGDIDVVSGGFP